MGRLTNYEMLLEEARKEDIIVREVPLRSNADGLYMNRKIAINKSIATQSQKACVLAEELGHHYTTVGNILDLNNLDNCKQELKARKVAYEKLVPLERIVYAFKELKFSEKFELIEFLNITEEFFDEAIEYYKSKEIFEKLEQLSTYKGQFTRYLVEFLTLTGLRPGEALALTHSDLRGKTLSITKRSVEGKIDTPKTKKSVREITVNSRVVQIVNEMELLKRIYQINSDIIFPNMCGTYSTTPGIYITLKKCGVYPSRLHIYRHTHASILAEMKIPLDVIQRRLGHEDSDITKKIYVHVTEKLKQEEQELFKSLEII